MELPDESIEDSTKDQIDPDFGIGIESWYTRHYQRIWVVLAMTGIKQLSGVELPERWQVLIATNSREVRLAD